MNGFKHDFEDRVPEFLLHRSDLSWEERQIIEYVRKEPCKSSELLSEMTTEKQK